MVRKLLGVVVVLIAALLVAGTPALAQGRGRAKRHRAARIEVRKDRSQRTPRVVVRTSPSVFFGGFSRSGRPPGWDRGRKTGWGNCDVPPGLAKKHGCRGFVFRGQNRGSQRGRVNRRGRVIRRGGVNRGGGVIVIPIPR